MSEQQILTISRRINTAEVEVIDNALRSRVISASSEYKVGDNVLVVSGVVVRNVGNIKVYTVNA